MTALFFFSFTIFAEDNASTEDSTSLKVAVPDYTSTADSDAFVFGEGAGVDAAIGFMPFYQFKIGGNEIPEAFGYNNTLNCWLWGIAARVSYVPLKVGKGEFGFGAEILYTYLSRSEDYYKLHAHLTLAQGLIVYKIQTENGTVIELHGGGGALMLGNIVYEFSEYTSDPLNKVYPSITGGIAVQRYVTKHFCIDTGWDMSYAFMDDSSFMILQPSISSGWHF